MAAFQKICSGIPEMDNALNYIRLGDNVVWQVDSLEEFKAFVQPFARQVIADDSYLLQCPKSYYILSSKQTLFAGERTVTSIGEVAVYIFYYFNYSCF